LQEYPEDLILAPLKEYLEVTLRFKLNRYIDEFTLAALLQRGGFPNESFSSLQPILQDYLISVFPGSEIFMEVYEKIEAKFAKQVAEEQQRLKRTAGRKEEEKDDDEEMKHGIFLETMNESPVTLEQLDFENLDEQEHEENQTRNQPRGKYEIVKREGPKRGKYSPGTRLFLFFPQFMDTDFDLNFLSFAHYESFLLLFAKECQKLLETSNRPHYSRGKLVTNSHGNNNGLVDFDKFILYFNSLDRMRGFAYHLKEDKNQPQRPGDQQRLEVLQELLVQLFFEVFPFDSRHPENDHWLTEGIASLTVNAINPLLFSCEAVLLAMTKHPKMKKLLLPPGHYQYDDYDNNSSVVEEDKEGEETEEEMVQFERDTFLKALDVLLVFHLREQQQQEQQEQSEQQQRRRRRNAMIFHPSAYLRIVSHVIFYYYLLLFSIIFLFFLFLV
jgi:hypothetical protein